jgi:hypothetical protein
LKPNKQPGRKKAKKSGGIWLLLGAVAVAAVLWFAYAGGSDGEEVIVTHDPANYSGRARQAYQAAKDAPEVLKEMPCYCGCMKNAGHEHNLHCFTDNHGAT